MSPPYLTRRAFTILEVVVVLAIITLLVALLLPAIQRVRETANQMICTSHLRSIGQAIAQMTADKKPFPMGGAAEDEMQQTWAFHFNPQAPEIPVRGPLQNWGWAYQILPELNYDSIWRARDTSPSTEAPPAEYSYQVPIKEFLCHCG